MNMESVPQSQREYFGKYRGQVVDNADPLKKGRLLVSVPQVLSEVTVWAEPCVPYAGRNQGFYAMPDVGGGVWIEFEAGDPSYPIWAGCFWADGDIADEDAAPDIKFFRTGKATIRVDDATGEVLIENNNGQSIRIASSEITIKAGTVNQEASGGKKTSLSPASFEVNGGNLEVL